MSHRLSGRKVNVRTGPDDLAVGVKPPLQDDDRVGGRVPVDAASHPGWIADHVVLLARGRILKEETETDIPIVDCRCGLARLPELERAQVIEDERLAYCCHARIVRQRLVVDVPAACAWVAAARAVLGVTIHLRCCSASLTCATTAIRFLNAV